jgi:formate hydrogenlyase transcriptional activator
MAQLCHYSWPGNVRELQNFIERAVILTSGKVLRLQFSDLQPYAPTASPPPEALKDVEREHIMQILRETKGVIGGRLGAAVRLGLPRTTLMSKMDRLGILRDPRAPPADREGDNQKAPLPIKS